MQAFWNALLAGLSTKTTKRADNVESCGYCSAPLNLVWVHGHAQCAVCKTNVRPCCDG